MTSIGNNAFQYCNAFTNIIIPNSVTSIGNEAFGSCSKLTSIKLPDGITAIDDDTFYACGLTSIVIPGGVAGIGQRAFQYCKALTELILLPITPPNLDLYALDKTPSNLVITVPKGTLDTYKADSDWSSYKNQMVEATE